MHKIKATALASFTAALSLTTYSGSASAATDIWPPQGWGNAPANVYIANIANVPSIVWKHQGTGECIVQPIGNQNGLFEYQRVHGAASGDTMITLWFSTTLCGISASPPTYGGFALDLFGGGGNDNVQNIAASADTWVFGESGNDMVVTYRTNGIASGGEGGDKVYGFSSGSGEGLFGGNGDDCLADSNASSAS